MSRRIAVTTAVALAACQPTADAPRPAPQPVTAPPAPPETLATTTTAATTTTTAAPVTTTAAPVPPVPRAPASTAPAPVVPPAGGGGDRDDAFWRRLADCECASGDCTGPHIGWFQFSGDTAPKVGIDGTEPYEEQRAAAIEWARRIHPNEGTRSGWPHCWWVAAA